MRGLTDFFVFFGFAILAIGYALLQLKTGESLQWIGEYVTRERHPLLFWGNVIGSGMAGICALMVSIFFLVQ
jgi:hypothetical protein